MVLEWHLGHTVPILRRVMRSRGLVLTTKPDGADRRPLRKAEMQLAITQHDAARILQRRWRGRGPIPSNTTDPITLQTIWRRQADGATLFSYTTPTGKRLVYSPRVLVRYVLRGGLFDPLTRQPYSCADLCRLAAQTGETFPLPPVLEQLLREFAVLIECAPSESAALENLLFHFTPCLRVSLEISNGTAAMTAAIVLRLRECARNTRRDWSALRVTLETVARVLVAL